MLDILSKDEKQKTALEIKQEQEMKRLAKIDLKKDILNEHKPTLDNLSSHDLYFREDLLTSILSGNLK
jgi:hypothetical protein